MEEEHFGIINGKVTVGINHHHLLSLGGLWAPPYVSSDFLLELRVQGERIRSNNYRWNPFEVEQEGNLGGIAVSCEVIGIAGRRAVAAVLHLENKTKEKKRVKLQFDIEGSLDFAKVWEFQRPRSRKVTQNSVENGLVVKAQGDYAVVLGATLEELRWFDLGFLWETQLELSAGERKTCYLCVAIGDKPQAIEDCRQFLAAPEKALSQSRAEYIKRARDLFNRLPVFEAADSRLVNLYQRSLLHLLTNKWEVPEFILHPYYSTGSIKGGCVCNYLWDFGENWKIFPLYDPQASKEHIKQFLKTDIFEHFSFNPMDGEAMGPWYPANHEKIIGLIYYYVMHTGDVQFLAETVSGKTVLDWTVYNALYGDDPQKPVAMIDFGPRNDHLELRREFTYNHIMPDLNGRRYANYLLAGRLCEIAGKPAPHLFERAEELKPILKKTLWDAEKQWFHFTGPGNPAEFRYTIQMFKLIGSGVLDEEEEAGLLSHLKEKEFLSDYGLHSMSKLDPAYDQIDIDNGGGGNYTGFPPQIIEKLYKAGYAEKAEDIIKRILWWGEKMPYWGDSLAANVIEYRKDTPLQCALTGASVAQCIIFGMFGIEVEPDGSITINPHPPAFSPSISLKGLRLRAMTLDIKVEADSYTVRTAAGAITSTVGKAVVIPS